MSVEKTENSVQINTCRICLSAAVSDCVVLNHDNLWMQLYEYCFGLTLSENDRPRKLCSTCSGLVKEFSNFKKKCHQSDQLWKSLVCNNLKCYSENYTDEDKFDLPLVKQENVQENQFILENDDVKPEIDELNNFDNSIEYSIEYNENTGTDEVKNVKSKRKKTKNKPKNKLDKQKAVVKKSEADTSHHCGLCNFTSPDIEATSRHLEEHRRNNDLSCKLCSYVGVDFGHMVSHRYEHFPRRSKLACHLCGLGFGVRARLQFHFRATHLAAAGGRCSRCGAAFARYTPWRRHERLHDAAVRRYVCDHCQRVYLYRHQIVEHLIDISDQKKFVCHTCGAAFKRHSNLTLHMSTVHVNTEVKCDHCEQTFKNKVRLNHHLKMLTKKKEFICKVCSKAFYNNGALKKHEFWHTGERPHPCEICGKRYKNKSQLVVHIKRHRGICNFKCSQCPKAFVTSTQLKVHRSVHTGVRRHRCPLCERSFNDKKLFKAHCWTKHKVENPDLSRTDANGK